MSTALFLSEKGIYPRIIDQKEKISKYSKALGVNPRTLELFEKLGLTPRFLENGRKMEKINIWYHDRLIYQNILSKIKHKYPFMLIQPQKESEELLLEELSNRRIELEFATEFKSLQPEQEAIRVQLLNGKLEEEEEYDVIVGADGAFSKVREQIGIQFQGFRYEEEWELYDVELEMDIAKDEGHIKLFREGGMVMIRLKDNVWRVAGNMKSLLNYLPKKTKIGQLDWKSTFKISHKIAESLEKENVLIIGDAAHLHSPVGARGMNLGVEDAYIASKLIAEKRIAEFTNLRRPYLKRTVSRINKMTQGLAGHHYLSRNLRANIGILSVAFPLVMPTIRKFIMGLNK